MIKRPKIGNKECEVGKSTEYEFERMESCCRGPVVTAIYSYI